MVKKLRRPSSPAALPVRNRPRLRPWRPAALAALLGFAAVVAAAPAEARGDRVPPDRACERLGLVLEWVDVLRSGHPWVAWWLAPLSHGLAVRIADDCVDLGQVQVLGTHNSYHVEPVPDLLQILAFFDPAFAAWQYTHPPLDEQFERLGIRQIELDVFADPEGGLYALRRGRQLLGLPADAGIPELDEPGFKVLHVQDVDYRTTCPTLRACLETLSAWSEENPGHLPVLVLIEAKDDAIVDPLDQGFTVPIPFDAALFRELDEEIRSVFPDERMLLPDDVRRGRPTLDEAVRELGWPRLGELRGKVLFALDNGGAKRAAYREGSPALEGRVLFTNSVPGDADGAFVKLNDAVGDFETIREAVAAGYLVRTRADADLEEARAEDFTTAEAALASGAQFVSTDFPEPDPRISERYEVGIPGGGPARCNPVSAPPGCRDRVLERRHRRAARR